MISREDIQQAVDSIASRDAEIGYALDVTWDDIDLDGDLDLAFAGIEGPNRVYLNHQTTGGGIQTTAGWSSIDLNYGNTGAFGDWDGNGYPEFAVADNGVGMSREELVENIGTIARSGTRELLAGLEEGAPSDDALRLIGQFGIGFYSAFMAADRVELVTRRAGERTATRWSSKVCRCSSSRCLRFHSTTAG